MNARYTPGQFLKQATPVNNYTSGDTYINEGNIYNLVSGPMVDLIKRPI